MRIPHVVPSYLPAVRYGGPIFAVHGLCQALAPRGHEVEVFTTNMDGPGNTRVPVGIQVRLMLSGSGIFGVLRSEGSTGRQDWHRTEIHRFDAVPSIRCFC